MKCVICKLEDRSVEQGSGADGYSVKCPRCGKYSISGTAYAVAQAQDSDFRLSAWIRSHEMMGSVPSLNSYTFQDAVVGLPRQGVSQRQTAFLQALEARSQFAGAWVHIVPEYDFTLAMCERVEELNFLVRALLQRNLVVLKGDVDPSSDFSWELSITALGWTFLEERARTNLGSVQCFVAMSFSDAMRSAWTQAISPAVSSAGWQPYRVDSHPHNERIDAKIVAEIRASRFLVVDVTEQKTGVYFEAGLAQGIGIPVIWSVRSDDLGNVHFDTRQFHHIVWHDEQQLQEQLQDSIAAIIGIGPVSNSGAQTRK